ncbi:TIGR00341 family protein [Algoriphagus aestuariicola]|uniref:TIGR00341 family protein n=1 Tax=Algoriphagus aestuariicola TaxID=1852016 RepID=A0ABS3BXW4_9BACT|nr:TIGR00341 family protein [Algoriphagus aestuariicola]MBN7803151.1 TIGR00341 family protein [Algoriphagus aestuariicola]
MQEYILVYDQGLDKDEVSSFVDKPDPAPTRTLTFSEFSLDDFGEKDRILFWVSDEQAIQIIEQADSSSPMLGFLPHPDLVQVRKALSIASSKSEALKRFFEVQEVNPLDILEVDSKTCINSLVIGKSLNVLYDPGDYRFFAAFKSRFLRFLNLFRRVKLQNYRITIKNKEEEKKLEIAAMGLLVVGHNESNLVFKRLIKDSGLGDGYLHVIAFAPRSLFSIIGFGLQNLFFPIKGGSIPEFVSYWSAEAMDIEGMDSELNYGLDGKEANASKLSMKISEKKPKIYTGFEVTKEETSKRKELNLEKLPTGRLREELTRSFLPWVGHATTDEFKDLFTLLKQNAQTSSNYLVLMALSTLIATFGLFADSSPVVIGAMILAPLMGPIISLAMGALRQDGILVKSSLITLFWGILIGLLFAVFITWVTPLKTMNSEILSRIRPNLLDLGIALVSGIAGAYAHAKEEIAKTLAGVAISVALVPPLAVAGIGLGWAEWNVFGGAALLLATNLAGIVMAAASTFLVLGFSPFRIAKKGLLISLAFFVLVTAPLVFSFRNMVLENRLIQDLTGKRIPHGLLREVKVINLNPLRISATILSEKELNAIDYKEIKQEIEAEIGRPADLELTLGIRIRE